MAYLIKDAYADKVKERHPGKPAELGKAISRICPKRKIPQVTNPNRKGPKQVRCYVFPPLEECREYWEQVPFYKIGNHLRFKEDDLTG